MAPTRSVLVSGASGGLGSALVATLAEGGWRVFAGVRRLSSADGFGDYVDPVELDITNEDSVTNAAQYVADEVGESGLHGLVNSAGVIVQGPMELVPIHALRRQFEVNVVGQVSLTQAVLPMLRRTRGTIVNIGAPTSDVAVPVAGPLSASKAAFASLTDVLRMELMHQGVAVTEVVPGAMDTAIFDKAAASSAADGYRGSQPTQQLYEATVSAAEKATAAMKRQPVDRAVSTVVQALSSDRPAPRYLVGIDARGVSVLSRLPRRLRDRLVMRAMGLPPQFAPYTGQVPRVRGKSGP